METKIESYSGAQREFVPEQYKQSTKLLGLIDAALTQCDDAEDALHELISGLSPETAVGPALDFRGALVGITRATGESDDNYRARILIGTGMEGLPSPETLRKMIMFLTGSASVGLFPNWPAELYYVLDGQTTADLSSLEEYMTSGASLVRGTFLIGEYDDNSDVEFGYLVNEDNGTPLVIDYREADTEYAIVDDEDYLIVDDEDNVVVGIDYLTINESFEIN